MARAQRRRLSIELEAQTVERLDAIATSRGVSRASLIQEACRRLATYSRTAEEEAAAEAAYAEAYRRIPEEPAYANVAFLAELLAEDEW
jgi:metal-responsive CopG/Arc/MetJ family transcriptional regulator